MLNSSIILDCQDVLPTSCGNFAKEIPPEICTAFLLDIFDTARVALKTEPIFPSLSSIERGLKGARARTASGVDDPQGNTIEKVLTREETLGRFLCKRRDSTWLYICTVTA